jgi:iron(III) transport system ATP-binding protein
VGAPEDLYARPATAMVAGFVGRGALIPVTVRGPEHGGVAVELAGQTLLAGGAAPPGPALLCLRPENIVVGAPGGLEATIEGATYRGGAYAVDLRLSDPAASRIEAILATPPPAGSTVPIRLSGGWVVAPDPTGAM